MLRFHRIRSTGRRILTSRTAVASRHLADRIIAIFHVGPAGTVEVAAIDGLRALAVSGVVVLHSWGAAGTPSLYLDIPIVGGRIWLSEWLHQGELGIPLFFILSGFLLGQPFFRAAYSDKPRPELRPYFKRRFFRLAPAYYVCLLLGILLFTPALIPAGLVYSLDGLKSLLAHLTFTHFLFIDTSAYFRIDASMWTLTHEALFYLVLPWVFFLFIGRRSLIALPGALLLTAGWLYLSHHSFDFWVDSLWANLDKYYWSHDVIRRTYLAPQFPAHAFNFALGLSLGSYYVQTQLGRAPRPHPLLALLIFALGCVMLAGWVHFFDFNNSWISRDFVFVGTPAETIGLTLVLAGVAFGVPVVSRFFSLVPIRVVGIISYSAFLWHGVLLYGVKQLPFIEALPPEQRVVPILGVLVPLLLVVSVASYLLVEKPFLIRARRPQSERQPQPPPASSGASAARPAPEATAG